ncbi:MAG: hypothetical protein WCK02_10870 [Bacteroidota bacterium]
MKKFSIHFIVVNFILCFYFIDLWSNAQNNSRGLPIVSYYENGNIYFDKYQDKTCDKSIVAGHIYSDKAPLPTFVALPIYGLLSKVGIIDIKSEKNKFNNIYAIGGILCGSLPFFLLIYLSFTNVLNRINYKELNFSAILLTMLPWYGSFLFIYTGTFFGHLFSGVLMLGAYIFYKKQKLFYCGLLAGLSVISEYTLVLIPVIWGLQTLFQQKTIKKLLPMFLGACPGIVFILTYNFLITSSPFDNLYNHVSADYSTPNYGFLFPTLTSIFGLTFSVYRGLFIFMPILFFALLIYLKNIRLSNVKYLFLHPIIFPAIILFFVISANHMWWGGWCFGPRHLTVVAILLGYETIPYLIEKGYNKILLWSFIAFGLIISIATKITLQYSFPTDIKNAITEALIPAFFKWDFNNNNLLSQSFAIDNAYSAAVWVLLLLSSIIALKQFFVKVCK